jgi:hypothetical protein
VGEWLRSASKPRGDGQRHNANIMPLSGLGNHRTNRTGSTKKPTARKFSLGSRKSRFLPYQRRSAYRNRTPQIFVRACAARIHGIGPR